MHIIYDIKQDKINIFGSNATKKKLIDEYVLRLKDVSEFFGEHLFFIKKTKTWWNNDAEKHNGLIFLPHYEKNIKYVDYKIWQLKILVFFFV